MSTTSGKQYGLLIRKKQPQQISRKSVFDDSDEEESESKKVEKQIVKESQKNQVKRQTQIEIQKALKEDPTVYDYDDVYDDIQKTKEIVKAATVPKEKKARYIQSLLKSAEQRKKENERRIERQIQKERQEEGESFADKESFVTTAYKKKLQELQEEEEREQREQRLEEMMDVTKQKDLSGFYRHFLNQTTGEEEIPEFGKRFSLSSAHTVKVEKMSPDREEVPSGNTETPSTSVTAKEKAKEALKKQRSYSKISDISLESDSSGHSAEQSSHSQKNAEKSTMPISEEQSKRKRTENEVDSDDSLSDSSENVNRPKKSSSNTREINSDFNVSKPKKERKFRQRHDSSSERESSLERERDKWLESTGNYKAPSSGAKELPPDKVQPSSEKQKLVDSPAVLSENSVVLPKRNIFEKRTVGNVLLEAKARYLARKEARDNVRQIFSTA